MHTEATTSHAALTGSPRVSATMANAIAPSTATPAHSSFDCRDMVTLQQRMGAGSVLAWQPSRSAWPSGHIGRALGFCIDVDQPALGLNANVPPPLWWALCRPTMPHRRWDR